MAAQQASAAPRTADGVSNAAPAPAPAAPAVADAPAPAPAAPVAAPAVQAAPVAAAAAKPAAAGAAPPAPAPRAAQSITIPLADGGAILPAERDRVWAEICTLLPPDLLESIRRAFRKKMHLVVDKMWAIQSRILKTALLRRHTSDDYLPGLLPKGNAFDLPSCLRDTADGKRFTEMFKAAQVKYAHEVTNTLAAMLCAAHDRYTLEARFEALWRAALCAVDERLAGFSACADHDANAATFSEDFFPETDRRHGSVKRRFAPALIALALLLRIELREYNERCEHALHAEIDKERKQTEERHNLDIAAQRDKSASVADISANAAHAAAQEASRPLESRVHKVENELQSIQGHLAQISAQLGQLVNGDRARPANTDARNTPPAASPRAPAQGPRPHQAARTRSNSSDHQVATNVARSPRAAPRPASPARPARPAAAAPAAPPAAAPSAAARPAPRHAAGTTPALPARTTALPVTTRAQRARNGRPLHEPRRAPVYTSSSDDEADAWESPRRRHVRYADSDADSDHFTPRRYSRSPPRRRNQPGNAFAALADHDRHATGDERAHAEDNRADTNAAQRPPSSQPSLWRASRGGFGRGGSRR